MVQISIRRKRARRFFIFGALLFFIFLLLNIIAIFQSYRFTHYTSSQKTEKKSSSKIEKILFGVSYPKAKNTVFPSRDYKEIYVSENPRLECWEVLVENPKGLVILFHGYTASKSDMLARSDYFNSLSYSTVLVDFMGAGGSEGYHTTIGYKEAEQVKEVFYFFKERTKEESILLLGTSMGAVAIMKACADYQIKPSGVILECPFGSMRQTVVNRFNEMKIPSFLLADFLVFWGGAINGFNAFSFQPYKDAKKIDVPSLLIGGKEDKKVIEKELLDIYSNLIGIKELIILPQSQHANYLEKDEYLWKNTINKWLEKEIK